MALSTKQRGVFLGMMVALGLTLAGILLVRLFGAMWAPRDVLTERIHYIARFDVGVVFCLFAHIAALARHRFFTPEDIDGSGLSQGSEQARIYQSLLQNTLEQSALALGVHMLWAILMPNAWVPVAVFGAISFVIGRISFAAGYAKGAPSRAFGFAFTFYPSVAMLLLLLAHLSVGL